MQQVALLANVASPESLLCLTEDGAQLQENISAVKDMISLKREEAEKLSKPQQVNYAQVTKSEDLDSQATVQKIQDPYTQGKHDDFLKDLQNFRHLAESTDDWLKILQQSVDTQETDTQNIPAKTKERLQELQVKKRCINDV